MHGYAATVRDHLGRKDPARLASIREPDRYFEDLAARIADEVTDLAEAYYRAETSGGEPDGLAERVGLRSMARLRAEEAVLPAYLAEHGGLD